MKLNPHRLAKRTLVSSVAFILAGGAALALNPDEWRHSQPVTVGQTGLVRVNLPASTLDAAQPDFSDLRVLDPGGSEVSFLVERPMPKPESVSQPQEFHSAINAGATTAVTIRTGSLAPVGAVRLETPALRFIKSVTVESSSDGLTWSPVAAGRPIFRLPGSAENLRIDFPANAYPWLRLTMDDRRDEPIPFIAASLISPPSGDAPLVPLPVAIKSRDESPGITRLSVDLGAANLPVASLEIDSSSHLFTRSVTVAEPVIQDGVLSERPLGEAVIYRLDLNGGTEQRLTIPIERQIKTRELLLLIDNQDSQPLAIDGVKGTRRDVRVLFYAPAPGSYTLLTGNSQCPAPHYDLSSLGERLRGDVSSILEPGPIAANPGYRIPEALGAISLQGGAIDPAKWKFRKPLPVANHGAQQVELDLDVLARASVDLSDIRIVQADHQIPYVLERTSMIRTIPLSATRKNVPDHPSLSRWLLALPQPRLPLTTLTCASSSPLFERSMRLREEVAGERGDTYPREIGRANWSRTPGDAKRPLGIKLDTVPQGGLLYLDTDNGDNAAIELNSFHGDYSATRVVFKAGDTSPAWLYYGNPEAGFPAYDLRLIADQLLHAERQPVAAGPQEATKPASGATSEPLAGTAGYLFWGALIAVVVVLLAVTAKLLPGENNAAPPPAGK